MRLVGCPQTPPRPALMPDIETDVLIVGAGPTGLMLANCLTKLGIRTVETRVR